jgi:hypothetical protein
MANQFILATNPLRLMTSDFIFQPNTCGYSPYVTSSLTRGWVCHLQLLLVLASVIILRSKSHRTPDPTVYCLRCETPPTLRARFLYLYPPGTGWPCYTPRHWVSSSLSLLCLADSTPFITSGELYRNHRLQGFQYCVCLCCAGYDVLIQGNSLILVFVATRCVLTIRFLATGYSSLPQECAQWSPTQQMVILWLSGIMSHYVTTLRHMQELFNTEWDKAKFMKDKWERMEDQVL